MNSISIKQQVHKKPAILFYEVWNTLIKEFGYSHAEQFLRMIRRGHGDSVKERKELWGGKNLEDIVVAIQKEKKGKRHI
jgi:hypothetical protein